MPTALISCHDKTGLASLARGLDGLGYRLVSTGGSARLLSSAGLDVTGVEELTGVPEMLDGRVKTLHPAVHAGILARRERPEDMRTLERLGIGPIDLVVVNLYPFAEAVARGEPHARVLEEIDVGGPTLVRAAAKNHASVLVVVSPAQYASLLARLRAGDVTLALRRELAAEAFAVTARYDAAIAAYLAADADDPLAPERLLVLASGTPLRYGENPHQRAVAYRAAGTAPGLVGTALVQGKPLSYNNLADAQAAMALAADLDRLGRGVAAVAVKHMTPCGAALAPTADAAYRRAHGADPVSIFGGVVALTGPVDAATARELARTFLEVVLAPDFTAEALDILAGKPSLRLLALPMPWSGPPVIYTAVGGGLLAQEADTALEPPSSWTRIGQQAASPEALAEAAFAWALVKHTRSNAIAVTRDGVSLGIGAGRVNRIDAARQALAQAGEAARGAVLASDGFFPFGDVLQAAAAAGIALVVEPGGSRRDNESIAAADAGGVALYFTGVRHFRHGV